MKYYIWTIGCQMNKAESSALSQHLDLLGMERTKNVRQADIAVLNTCVVRQNAEDKVIGMLGYLKGIKKENPGMRIAVTGCLVSDELKDLQHSFPHVDYFFKPGEPRYFEDWLYAESIGVGPALVEKATCPPTPVSVYIPIIQGCNNFCSYCIVPFRRGRERSRPPVEIVEQARTLVSRGAREIILLGQNVNAYGKDLDKGTGLAGLLTDLNQLSGLLRIRFLTNHPRDLNTALINAIASLDKVCHHLCLPLQAGDDGILQAMNRNYTCDQYKSLIKRLREAVPDVAVSTDVIVGFPGESEEQFMNTFRAVEEISFEAVHVAAYSIRPQTYACDNLADDVPYETKMQRLRQIEALQTGILEKNNQKTIGKKVEVLVEGKKGDKWFGRTHSDKPVFFKDERDLTGKLVRIEVSLASPWALQGTLSS